MTAVGTADEKDYVKKIGYHACIGQSEASSYDRNVRTVFPKVTRIPGQFFVPSVFFRLVQQYRDIFKKEKREIEPSKDIAR